MTTGVELPLAFELGFAEHFHCGEVFAIYPDRLIWFRKRDRDRLPHGAADPERLARLLAVKSVGPKQMLSWAEVTRVCVAPVAWHGSIVWGTQLAAGRVDVETRDGHVLTALVAPKHLPLVKSLLRRLLGEERVVMSPRERVIRRGASSLKWWLLGSTLLVLAVFMALVAGAPSGPCAVGLVVGALGFSLFGWMFVIRLVRCLAQRVEGHTEAIVEASQRQPLRSRPLGVAAKVLGVALGVVCIVLIGRALPCMMYFATDPVGKAMWSAQRNQMLLHWAGLALGGLLVKAGYRLSLPSAADILRSGAPVILLLRGFTDDGAHDFNPSPVPAWLSKHAAFARALMSWFVIADPGRLLRLLRQGAADTSEEQLRRALVPHGELVAIGRPGEWLARGGAARMYTEQEGEWQEWVRRLLPRAKWVVLQPGEGEGVWWEIEEVFQRTPRRRVIISLFHFRALPQRWQLFRTLLRERTGIALPEDTGAALFIGFDALDRPMLMEPVYHGVMAAALRGCAIDLAATLAPSLTGSTPARRAAPRPVARLAWRVVNTAFGIALTLWAYQRFWPHTHAEEVAACARPNPVLPAAARHAPRR